MWDDACWSVTQSVCADPTKTSTRVEAEKLEEGWAPSQRSSNALAVSRTLPFTPISLVWQDLEYYVTVPKGLTGAAAANVMTLETTEDAALIGKKRLLNGITGTRGCKPVSRGGIKAYRFAAIGAEHACRFACS